MQKSIEESIYIHFFLYMNHLKGVWEKLLEYFSFGLQNKLCSLKAEKKNMNNKLLKESPD